MCGIAGVLSASAPRRTTVERMVALLTHRGPDADGFWSSGPYCAGMRRLSIVDVAGGGQPLFDETGRIVLFYNGEIYNSPALRAELEGDGVEFRTHSDGEVICHLYRRHGRDVFGRLDGQFAVALWDDEKQVLLLARDVPGEKPLYYSALPDGIAFASEIRSLLEHERVSRDLDLQSLWDYPSFLWVPEPATIYRGVRALAPGHGLEVSTRGMTHFSFADCPPVPDLPHASDRDAIASVRLVVEAAVKSRLLSDVPVGAFLSGGLDSSIISTIASRERHDLQTFCVGFDNVADPYHGESDESALAQSYANILGTRHTTVHLSSARCRAMLPQLVRAAGQPYAVSSGLGILAIACEARERGVKVLLSGDGADEAFGGYSWYPAIPQSMSAVPAEGGEILRFLDRDGSRADRVARVAGYPPRLRAWAWHYYASESEKAALFHADIRAESSLHWFDDAALDEPLDYVRHDRRFYFPNEMLSKVDRMTMACSVEGRAPFAAPSVQGFAGRLSWDKLVRGDELKWVLRQAFADVLPPEVVARPKHGFNVPIDHWLHGEWNDLLHDTFAESAPLRRHNIVRPDALAAALRILDDPRKVAGHVLFTFVMLHLWMSEN